MTEPRAAVGMSGQGSGIADELAWQRLAEGADALGVEECAVMPTGFAAASTSAGIKPSGRPDLAVLVVTTPEPASATGLFTRNLVQAAPVRVSRANLESSGGLARVVGITAGSANAATGPAGDADEDRIVAALADAASCPGDQVLRASTGLIGTRIPVDRVAAAIGSLVPARVARDDGALEGAARAMMTTDTRLKAATAVIDVAAGDRRRSVRVSGIVKGVGMIHPGMATMIAVLLTDAAVSPTTLASLLRPAVAMSFDQLTVDGDTSTNDTVLALASGAAGADEIVPGSADADALGAALAAVCRSLARQQAADGEGATCRIACRVRGAERLADARAVSRAVVASSLVKAAVHGRDPNWGRVAAAAGAARRPDGSAVSLDPAALRIALCGTEVFAGRPIPFDVEAVRGAMAAPEVTVELDLGRGSASAEAWGCDLTEAYVRENAEYST